MSNTPECDSLDEHLRHDGFTQPAAEASMWRDLARNLEARLAIMKSGPFRSRIPDLTRTPGIVFRADEGMWPRCPRCGSQNTMEIFGHDLSCCDCNHGWTP